MRIVLLGHASVRMTEVGCDHLQRRAGHYEMRGVSVAENVKRGRRRDASRLAGLREWALGVRLPPSLSVHSRQEQGSIRLACGKPTEEDDSVVCQNDMARLPALSSSDSDCAGSAIEILQAKRG